MVSDTGCIAVSRVSCLSVFMPRFMLQVAVFLSSCLMLCIVVFYVLFMRLVLCRYVFHAVLPCFVTHFMLCCTPILCQASCRTPCCVVCHVSCCAPCCVVCHVSCCVVSHVSCCVVSHVSCCVVSHVLCCTYAVLHAVLCATFHTVF